MKFFLRLICALFIGVVGCAGACQPDVTTTHAARGTGACSGYGWKAAASGEALSMTVAGPPGQDTLWLAEDGTAWRLSTVQGKTYGVKDAVGVQGQCASLCPVDHKAGACLLVDTAGSGDACLASKKGRLCAQVKGE